MAPYPSNGSLTTDKRTVDDSATWDSQAEWEAYQEAMDVEIVNGAVQLADVAIPDSVDHHWPTDEGSGSTLTDNKGTVDGTINGETWVSDSNAVGDFVLDSDGTDDYTNLGADTLNFHYNGDFTFTRYITFDDLSKDNTIYEHFDGSNGIELRYNAGNDSISMIYHGVAFYHSELSPTQGTMHFVSVRFDSSAGELVFDLDTSTATVTGVNQPNQPASGTEWWLNSETGGADYRDGVADEATASASYLSNSDIETLRTRRGDL